MSRNRHDSQSTSSGFTSKNPNNKLSELTQSDISKIAESYLERKQNLEKSASIVNYTRVIVTLVAVTSIHFSSSLLSQRVAQRVEALLFPISALALIGIDASAIAEKLSKRENKRNRY